MAGEGSIRPDVSQTAAAEIMNKMRLGTRGSTQGFRREMQGINSTKYFLSQS